VVLQLFSPASNRSICASKSLRSTTMVLVGSPSLTRVIRKVCTEAGMPTARIRAVRPIALGS
jgi:hypothetical protein